MRPTFTRAATALAAAGLLALAGCTTANTSPSTQALHYKGGSFSDQKFDECIAAGTRSYEGPGDRIYHYPVGQRTFSFRNKAEGSDADAVTIKTKDAQQMTVVGLVTFELTSDCERLRTFHEQIGLKYQAYFAEGADDSDGWSRFLTDYLLTPLNSTMDKAGLQQNWRTLYSSTEAVTAFEESVFRDLPAEVGKLVDRDLLTIKSISIETPQPGEVLLKSLEAVEAAKSEAEAQRQRNGVARARYDSLAECMKVASEAGCVMLKLAEDGKIAFVPVPQGGDLNVNTP